MRLSNPAEVSGSGIYGAKGGRNYKVTPLSPDAATPRACRLTTSAV